MKHFGIVTSTRQGRHCIYALNGPLFVSTLQGIMAKVYEHAALCCPPDLMSKGK